MKALNSMTKDFQGFPGMSGLTGLATDATSDKNQQGSEVPQKGPTKTKEEQEAHTDEL